MEPSSPNDLAFFYLYDYTTPPRRHHRTYHRRHASTHSPSPTAHLEKATTRRTLHLEAKRTKVATHNENIRHVLAQYKLDDTRTRLAELLERMARADDNRGRLLKLTAENCGRKVEEAKIRARRVKRERDEIARIASRDILERLENAEKRREELLSAKGRRSPNHRTLISEQTKVEAATKIQRFWKRHRLQTAVAEFKALRISVESVTSHSFEQVVSKFKSATLIRATARLLTILNLAPCTTPEKDTDNLVRTLLSAYMVLGHTTEVLHSHDQPLETVPHTLTISNAFQDLTLKARTFLTALESGIRTLHPPSNLSALWESYLSAFREWKTHDASVLVEMLVGKFVELDTMLLDIQESSTMQAVVEDYSQAIKSGQMLLLSKIRRLVGDETRNLVRRAIQAGRRRRLQQQQQQQEPPQPTVIEEQVPEEIVGELIEPPGSSGLSNRRIIHELAINPEYEIMPPEKTENQRIQEEIFQNTFYRSLESSLRSNDQSLLPTVVRDIKSRLLSSLQPSTPSYTTLSEHLDDTIVQQQCQRGLFDLQQLLSYVQNTMRQLCAPIRDDDVRAINLIIGTDDIDTFVSRVSRIMEVLGQMALDSANFHLKLMRPALLAQALQYERTKFSEDLENKRIALDKTTRWIESTLQTVDQRDVPTVTTFRHAFIDLLFSDVEIPETFDFDVERITTLRTKVHDTIILAALVLVARTFAVGNSSRPLDYSVLTRRLAIIQNDPTENILAEIDRFIASPQIKPEMLLSMIRRVKSDPRDPCVLLLQRRLKTALMTVLNGGEVGTMAGLTEVEAEIKEIGLLVAGLARVNWGSYREWYEDIVKSYLERELRAREE